EPLAVAAAWAGEEGRSGMKGLAVALDPSTSAWLGGSVLAQPAVHSALSRLLGPEGPPLEAHRAKELMRGLAVLGVDVASLDVDTAIAAYLIDPAEGQYTLEGVAARYAGLEVRSPDAPPPGQLDLDGTGSSPAEDSGRRAQAVARLSPVLDLAMGARGLRRLYDDVER